MVRNMIKRKQRIIIAIVVAVMVAAQALPSGVAAGASAAAFDASALGADGPAATELRMRAGVPGFTCGGTAYESPAPLPAGGVLFLPLRAAAEAFGASLAYAEQPGADAAPPAAGRNYPLITGSFMGREFIFGADEDFYTVSGAAEKLPERLMIAGGVAYVPAYAFDKCMGTETAYDAETGEVSIWLGDDGRVTDLSAMLGEIKEAAVADSYYNWRINIPRKSLLVSSSFNGDEVLIYSPLRNALIEIAVRPGYGRTADYYMENMGDISEDMYVESAEIVKAGGSVCVQAILFDGGDVAVTRLYPRGRQEYIATVYVLNDGDGYGGFGTSDFLVDNPYTKIVESFELRGVGAGERNVRDLTKVKGDRIEYLHYLDIPESKTLLTPWSISILPAWSVLLESEEDGILAVLGADGNENVSVRVEEMPPQVAAGEYLENYADLEAARYNPGAYSLIESRVSEKNGDMILDISYILSYGGKSYVICERLVPKGELLFRVLLKASKQRFDIRKEIYLDIIDSFETRLPGNSPLAKYLAKQSAELKKMRISAGDGPAEVGGAALNWSSRLPGGWITDGGSWYSDVSSDAGIYIDHVFLDEGEDALENEDILWLLEEADADVPKDAVFGKNAYTAITYARELDHDLCVCRYPGVPMSGCVYIYESDEGAYVIYTEIPYIYDNPLNRAGFEMFLKEFCAGENYVKLKAGAQESGKPKRPVAVG